eukprot:TRINITY_DN8177_c0_g1_i1.p1 TRINITY_DN8177_c0_g1~~TRINITY_DN8177_c0_g1_i1.p1  ORF type:complete len:580 (+),score=-3.18 TRINITY_DN8177_c0_g1_i1:213-1952(+)
MGSSVLQPHFPVDSLTVGHNDSHMSAQPRAPHCSLSSVKDIGAVKGAPPCNPLAVEMQHRAASPPAQPGNESEMELKVMGFPSVSSSDTMTTFGDMDTLTVSSVDFRDQSETSTTSAGSSPSEASGVTANSHSGREPTGVSPILSEPSGGLQSSGFQGLVEVFPAKSEPAARAADALKVTQVSSLNIVCKKTLQRRMSNCGAAQKLENMKGQRIPRNGSSRKNCLAAFGAVNDGEDDEEVEEVRKAWSARVTRGHESGHVDWEECRAELVQWEIDPSQLVIQDFVARGSFGSVHRGAYGGREVAVKLLNWGQSAAEKMTAAEREFIRDLFAQEVLVWSKLHHKHICQFVGAMLGGPDAYSFPSTVVDHDGQLHVSSHVCCVVLEYLGGGTLKGLLAEMQERKKRLPLKRVVQIGLQVGEGLKYLHSRKIVHRDLKSDNLLFDDKRKIVKIADFGIARAAPSDKSMCRRTGTYGYMAPEVLKERPYNVSCDIYSFGIVLWELYCCKNPFPFANLQPEEVCSLVNQGVRPEIPRDCPPALASLMRSCWHQDPEKRPAMAEVVEQLQELDRELSKVVSCACM